jgi:hypothetical protein
MTPPILGIWASSKLVATNSYESIATANGTGSSGVITFSSIPSTYKHLQIRWTNKSTSNGSYLWLNFNSDTASNYANHYLYGSGTNVISGSEPTQTKINIYGSLATSTVASVHNSHIVDLLDYSSTNKNKTVRALGGQEDNSAGIILLSSGLWMNSSTAINSITITANTSNFATTSIFALYGIKG